MNTENRKWLRLVGLYHDVQLWTPDTREAKCPWLRRYQGGLKSGEQWISQALEKHRIRIIPTAELLMPDEDFSTMVYINMAFVTKIHGQAADKKKGTPARPGRSTLHEVCVYVHGIPKWS